MPDDLRLAVGYDLGPRAAARWLDRLPGVLGGYAARWSLELGAIMPGGRLSACVAARDQVGRAVVLKVPTSAAAGRLELAALQAWQGGPVPRVHRRDARTGVFTMERILPGTPAQDDPRAVAALLDALHSTGAVSETRYPSLRSALGDRLRRAEQRRDLPGNAVGRALYDRAAALLAALPAASEGPRTLLHGDLQTKNLLSATDGAVRAIDPLPCVGDPAFDAATWSVLCDSSEPIGVRVERIARALACDPATIGPWAALLCALEYRPYRPEQAGRMLAYVGG